MNDSTILGDLVGAYGTLDSPNYSFAERRYARSPYSSLLAELSIAYPLQETTDLNDDVSVCCSLDSSATGWGLRLSLVGNYAAVNDSGGRFLSAADLSARPEAARLVDCLEGAQMRLLGPDELRAPVDFATATEERRTATVYEALFSSDGAMPDCKTPVPG